MVEVVRSGRCGRSGNEVVDEDEGSTFFVLEYEIPPSNTGLLTCETRIVKKKYNRYRINTVEKHYM